MNDVLYYFEFPQEVKFDIPITKLSLKNNENCTLSDQKLLDGANIQSIRIKALLKQETANIAYYRNADELYIEIYVIEVTIQSDVYTKIYKPVSHLIHKLIPHHCIVILQDDDVLNAHFSLATKTISKNQNTQRIIQREYYSNNLSVLNDLFVEALCYKNANKHDLRAFYQYYIQVLQNYNLLDATQGFKLRSYEVTEYMLEVQDSIAEYVIQMNKSIRELKTAIQISEKVRINSDIHRLKIKIQELKNTLSNYGED